MKNQGRPINTVIKDTARIHNKYKYKSHKTEKKKIYKHITLHIPVKCINATMSNMGKLSNLQFCPCSLQESEEKKKSMQEICDKDSIYMT